MIITTFVDASKMEKLLTESYDGLQQLLRNKNLWLSVKNKRGRYSLHITVAHPLKLRKALSTVAYVQYPGNTVDNIFYQVIDNGSLPIVSHRNKDGKEEKK